MDPKGLYMFMNYVQAAYILEKIGVIGDKGFKNIDNQNRKDLQTLIQSVGYKAVEKYLEGINCTVTEYTKSRVRDAVIWEDDSKYVRGCPSIESLCQGLKNKSFCDRDPKLSRE